MYDKKIAAERIVMFVVIGALWKKRHLYTIMHYKEELNDQTIVLDFEENIEKLQTHIYSKMPGYRRDK
jgi:hypothetical protein